MSRFAKCISDMAVFTPALSDPVCGSVIVDEVVCDKVGTQLPVDAYGESADHLDRTLPVVSNKASVTGLENLTTYYFQVTATNGASGLAPACPATRVTWMVTFFTATRRPRSMVTTRSPAVGPMA